MKLQRIIQFFCGLLLLALGNGCVTKALWQNDNLEAWNEPASEPNVQLFDGKPKRDLLVVYDEYGERRGTIQTRAYWLNENQYLVVQHRTPHFVSTNSISGLTAVPIILASTNQNNLPSACYASLEANHQSFTLYLHDGQVGSHELPLYKDGKGKAAKIFLTPPAVTADLTIVGAFIGYLYLEGQSSGYNASY
jgi:hypothetical protein